MSHLQTVLWTTIYICGNWSPLRSKESLRCP